MVLLGKVSNGTVILPPDSPLADGTEVEVRPLPTGDQTALSSAVADLTDELVALAVQTRGLPADLASQHDHYLHGQPVRSATERGETAAPSVSWSFPEGRHLGEFPAPAKAWRCLASGD